MSTNTSNKKTKRGLKLKDISKVDMKAVEDKLVQARVSLLIHQPFFGNMATRLVLVRAESWCDTAATDGRNFYYNPSFIDSLTARQLEFLFGHEVLHNCFEHLGRKETRNHMLWNIAADYVVNQILVDNNVGKIIPDLLLDAKYKDWYAEQVYDDLNEKYGQDGKTLEELIDKMIDEHLEVGYGDQETDENGRPVIKECDKQSIRDEIREAMITAASQCAGKMPAGIKRMVDMFTQPKMNWRELLRQTMQSTIVSNFSYLRPNRKTQFDGIVIPGVVKGEEIEVCVAIDASGSITDADAATFLSEIRGIMDQYDNFSVRVWSFDTKVYNDCTYTADDNDIENYQIHGGGGTSINANWDYMKENDVNPKLFIMFTDGFGDGWGDPDYCETIFILKNSNKTVEPSHGTSIVYEEN